MLKVEKKNCMWQARIVGHEASSMMAALDSPLAMIGDMKLLPVMEQKSVVSKKKRGRPPVASPSLPANQSPSMPSRILRIREVIDLTGMSKSTLMRLQRSGDFPSRIRIGDKAVGWREREVLAWIQSRQLASNDPAQDDPVDMNS
jgi:prophage regulatory protein